MIQFLADPNHTGSFYGRKTLALWFLRCLPSKQQLRALARGAVLPTVLLMIWVVSARHQTSSSLVPAPRHVIHALQTMLADGSLLAALSLSLKRDLTGCLFGIVSGLLVGIAIGCSYYTRRLVLPSLDSLKLISPFAWVGLIMAWFGLGEASKLAFIGLLSFLPMLYSTIAGLAASSAGLVELGRVNRLNPFQILLFIRLPAALPAILNGISLALVSGWLGTLASEYMLTSGGGIGAALVMAHDTFDTAALVVDIAVIGITGFLFHVIMSFVENRTLYWRKTPVIGAGRGIQPDE